MVTLEFRDLIEADDFDDCEMWLLNEDLRFFKIDEKLFECAALDGI